MTETVTMNQGATLKNAAKIEAEIEGIPPASQDWNEDGVVRHDREIDDRLKIAKDRGSTTGKQTNTIDHQFHQHLTVRDGRTSRPVNHGPVPSPGEGEDHDEQSTRD